MDFSIRSAMSSDVEAIRTCLQLAFSGYRDTYTPAAYEDTVPTSEGVARRLSSMTVLVAVDGAGGVVGTVACAVRPGGKGYLRGMAVIPSWQGRGVARSLLAAVEVVLATRGCNEIILDTTRPLMPAIRLYETKGYQPTGIIGDFHGMELIQYSKSLRR